MMCKKTGIVTGLVAFAGLVVGMSSFKSAPDRKKEKRPNFIIIMADDMGYSDPGCFGGEIHTPNIDWLASNGVRFTDFYNTSRCCPTRASLLTGLYNEQAGIGEMTTDQHLPGYRGYLTENTVTIAEVLKTAGYQTAMSGKWHVSNTNTQPTKKEQLAWLNHQAFHPLFSPLAQYPVKRGFDRFFGTIWGVVDHFDPFSLVHDSTAITEVPKGYYHTDAINDSAAAFIRQMSKNDAPFFLYVAENAAHWPLMAKPEDIAKYENTYKVGWDSIRNNRYRRMVKMGVINPTDAPLPERWHENQDWDNNPDTAWDARAMAVHAAMVDCMDQGIGRIIESLKQTGELDNTVIIFLSDNGASPEFCANFGPGFDRPSETRDGRTINYDKDKKVMPGPETTYASIGPRWANVANTPYQYWKAMAYEGGIRTPMVVYWPKGLKAKKGSFNHHLSHVMDFMATFVDMAKAKYPKQFHGHQITPMEGESLLPVFTGHQTVRRKPLFNEHFGNRYVRYQNWKLVKKADEKGWHLYDMLTDATETKDLSAKRPDVRLTLQKMWDAWAKRAQVFPKP